MKNNITETWLTSSKSYSPFYLWNNVYLAFPLTFPFSHFQAVNMHITVLIIQVCLVLLL